MPDMSSATCKARRQEDGQIARPIFPGTTVMDLIRPHVMPTR